MEAPSRKVNAGLVAGAVMVITAWGLGLAGIEVPAEVALAGQTLIVGFIQYWVPNKE